MIPRHSTISALRCSRKNATRRPWRIASKRLPSSPTTLRRSAIAAPSCWLLGRYAEALASIDRALALKPDFVEALINRGNTLQALGRHAEAIEPIAVRRASNRVTRMRCTTKASPTCVSAISRPAGSNTNVDGRERTPPSSGRSRARKWLGAEAIQGKRLLLWAEQGLGDTIQFCRYAPILARKGIEVCLEVPLPLKALMGTLEGVTAVITETDSPPAHRLPLPVCSACRWP